MFRKFNSRIDFTRPIVEDFHIPQQVVDPLSPRISQTLVISQKLDITSQDYVKNIPTPEEYSLQNLLQSGVPLEVVNTSSLLNPSDSSVYNEIAETINNEILESQKSVEQ